MGLRVQGDAAVLLHPTASGRCSDACDVDATYSAKQTPDPLALVGRGHGHFGVPMVSRQMSDEGMFATPEQCALCCWNTSCSNQHCWGWWRCPMSSAQHLLNACSAEPPRQHSSFLEGAQQADGTVTFFSC